MLKPKILLIAMLVILFGILFRTTQATVLHYPSQYATFNEAYNVAQPGDTIFIDPGTHHIIQPLQKPCLTILGAGTELTMLLDSKFEVTTPDTCLLIKNIQFICPNTEGVWIYDGCRIDSCEFGGGAGSYYGAVRAAGDYVIRNSFFRYNINDGAGALGGAIHTGNCTAIIEDNLFEWNTAQSGGAIYLAQGPLPVIRYNLFIQNSAERGGAIHCAYSVLDSLYIYNNTFHRNAADWGAALYFNGGASAKDRCFNNIFDSSRGDAAVRSYSSDCIWGTCNDYWGNANGDVGHMYGLCDLPSSETQNMFVDPMFCDPASGDFTIDYHSPCATHASCGFIGARSVGCTSGPRTWHVETSGDDLSGDGSLANPFLTIQRGIDASSSDDTVMVGPGTFTGAGNTNINVTKHAITLTGRLGADSTTIDGGGEGTLLAILEFSDTEAITVDGLTFRNAETAISLDTAHAAFRNCRFIDFSAYGVHMSWPQRSRSIISCSFDSCRVGVFARDTCIIRHCVFGYSDTAVHRIHKVRIDSSRIHNCDLGVYSEDVWLSDTTVAAIDCVDFEANTLAGYGRSYYENCVVHNGMHGVDAAAMYNNDYIVRNCKFDSLTGTAFLSTFWGEIITSEVSNISGAIVTHGNADDLTTFADCAIFDNSGVFCQTDRASHVTLTRCLYVGNDSALTTHPASLRLRNCTVVGNHSDGVVVADDAFGPSEIDHCIIANNGGTGVRCLYGTPSLSITCTDAFGNIGGNYESVPDPTGSNGNISEDPRFCDLAGRDYHLMDTSPCAPLNNSCDSVMGAFPVGCSCCMLRGDCTDDGAIKVSDLTMLIAYLFRGGPAPACLEHGDCNADGSIKVSDLTLLIAYLFRSGPPPAPCL